MECAISLTPCCYYYAPCVFNDISPTSTWTSSVAGPFADSFRMSANPSLESDAQACTVQTLSLAFCMGIIT